MRMKEDNKAVTEPVSDRPTAAYFDPWEAKFNSHYLPPNTAIAKQPRVGLKPKAA
jgi:hypothetical protein